MKTLKTSNIILTGFALAIVIFIVTQLNYSTYNPKFNSKNAVYSEVKIENFRPFKYLVLNGYRQVTYEVRSGNAFKLEIFSHPRYSDTCNKWFRKDTLFVNIYNKKFEFTESANVPDIKITIPYALNAIIVRNVFCNISDLQQDTLMIEGINNYTRVTIENSKIRKISFKGKNSKLTLNDTDTIEELEYQNRGEFAFLELNNLIINKLNLNKDSTSVSLSGKAIEYYLNK
jgi:hypothetical protein